MIGRDASAGEGRAADTAAPRTLLVADDDATFRTRLARAFEARGYVVAVAGSADEALALARHDSPEMAIVDLRMPGASGLSLVRDLRQVDPGTRIVVLTGYGSIATAVEAMRLGATGYVPKPANVDEILAAFAKGEVATPAAAEAAPAAQERAPAPVAPGGAPAGQTIETPSLARAEWEHINRVLGDCGGNVSEAARRLGIHRRSLQRKLHKMAPS